MEKVVLAYSGGLDTSIIIPWLKENYDCEVVAMAANLGQEEDWEALELKALKSGASKLYVEDLRQEFVEQYIWPTLKASAVYEGKYLLGTSFARPLIAKRLVEIALQENADAIAHGCTGKGNDQVRFELGIKALAPHLKVIAPWRLWSLRSREDAMDYAAQRGIPVSANRSRPYSMDGNLWHLSHEGGLLEDPWNEPPSDVLLLAVKPELAPEVAEYVELEFVEGIPIALDGNAMPGVALITELNQIAAKHGVGVVDMVENRLVGMKSRGIYETPGGTVLYAAHRELELLCLDRATLHYKDLVAQRYAELVYDGMWFHPLREALDAFVTSTQRTVSGTVRMKLYKGNCYPAGARSPYSLYDHDLATFGEDGVYCQSDAAGFINLFGLPLTVQAKMRQKLKSQQ